MGIIQFKFRKLNHRRWKFVTLNLSTTCNPNFCFCTKRVLLTCSRCLFVAVRRRSGVSASPIGGEHNNDGNNNNKGMVVSQQQNMTGEKKEHPPQQQKQTWRAGMFMIALAIQYGVQPLISKRCTGYVRPSTRYYGVTFLSWFLLFSSFFGCICILLFLLLFRVLKKCIFLSCG